MEKDIDYENNSEEIKFRLGETDKLEIEKLVKESKGKYSSVSHFLKCQSQKAIREEQFKSGLADLREFLKTNNPYKDFHKEWFAAGGDLNELHSIIVNRRLHAIL